MTDSGNEGDWTRKDRHRHLVEARKHMWRSSTIAKIAEAAGIDRGATVADVGCGLGYLGWTFRPHFGRDGIYLGIDISEELLREAGELALDWSSDGSAFFAKGSAYSIPLRPDISDCTMCQTLLMHLQHPDRALEEMIRITRPGGAVLCIEPDNVIMCVPYTSDPPLSDRELLWMFRMRLIWARGRKRLGKGDWGIGRRLPKMLSDAGLQKVRVFFNDTPYHINPPYETEHQQYRLRKIREAMEEDREREHEASIREWKECFLAGGGSLSSYYRYRKHFDSIWEENRRLALDQMDEGTFFRGLSGSSFYCVTAIKPLP